MRPSGEPIAGPDEDEDLEAEIAADCPEGHWLLDNNAWADLLQALFPAGGSVDSANGTDRGNWSDDDGCVTTRSSH